MTKMLAAALLALTVGTGGCYAVTDLDRFEKADEAPISNEQSSTHRDLRLTMVSMKPHASHFFEYRIVNEANLVISAGVFEETGAHPTPTEEKGPPITLYIANAVPRQGNYRLDFYADVNGSRSYDGIGDIKTHDHAWRVESLNEPPPSAGQIIDDRLIDLTHVHNANLVDIDAVNGAYQPPQRPGSDVVVRLTNMAAFVDKLVEVRVIDHTSGHVVGLYRFPRLLSAEQVCTLPGLVESGVDYDIEIYADANGDRVYQPTGDPSGDGGWRMRVAANEQGIDVSIDPAAAPTQVGVLFTYLVSRGARA